MGVHYSIAKLARFPEFELAEDEAEAIAESAREVAKHYNIEEIAGLEKHLAVANLVAVLGGIYGRKFLDAAARRKSERGAMRVKKEDFPSSRQPQQAEEATIVELHPITEPG